MLQNEIKIKNNKASIIISNLKCTEDECPNCPRMHVSFDINFKSLEYAFKVNFSEMVYSQFDFKQGKNEIIDENFQEKRLIINNNEICLQIQEIDDELVNINAQFKLNADEDEIDNFKIELSAYIDYVLKS